jgi:hypothetical protein
MKATDRLADIFTFPNFVPQEDCTISPDGERITISMKEEDRPQKVFAVAAVRNAPPSTTIGRAMSATCQRAAIT